MQGCERMGRKRSALKSRLFRLYSLLSKLGGGILNLLLPSLRVLALKIFLGQLGKNSWVDYGTYFRYPWQVFIGPNCTINRKCAFYTSYYHKDVSIRLGKHVQVSPEVIFFAAGHDYKQLTRLDTAASITVGDEAWIGARSIILQGVTIGEGAVIGAGSVVTHDIPAWSIAVGNPARVIKQRALADAENDTAFDID